MANPIRVREGGAVVSPVVRGPKLPAVVPLERDAQVNIVNACRKFAAAEFGRALPWLEAKSVAEAEQEVAAAVIEALGLRNQPAEVIVKEIERNPELVKRVFMGLADERGAIQSRGTEGSTANPTVNPTANPTVSHPTVSYPTVAKLAGSDLTGAELGALSAPERTSSSSPGVAGASARSQVAQPNKSRVSREQREGYFMYDYLDAFGGRRPGIVSIEELNKVYDDVRQLLEAHAIPIRETTSPAGRFTAMLNRSDKELERLPGTSAGKYPENLRVTFEIRSDDFKLPTTASKLPPPIEDLFLTSPKAKELMQKAESLGLKVVIDPSAGKMEGGSNGYLEILEDGKRCIAIKPDAKVATFIHEMQHGEDLQALDAWKKSFRQRQELTPWPLNNLENYKRISSIKKKLREIGGYDPLESARLAKVLYGIHEDLPELSSDVATLLETRAVRSHVMYALEQAELAAKRDDRWRSRLWLLDAQKAQQYAFSHQITGLQFDVKRYAYFIDSYRSNGLDLMVKYYEKQLALAGERLDKLYYWKGALIDASDALKKTDIRSEEEKELGRELEKLGL